MDGWWEGGFACCDKLGSGRGGGVRVSEEMDGISRSGVWVI